jgi:hypothetical protein
MRRAMRTALDLAVILSGAVAGLEQPLVAGQAAHARHMELPPVVLPYGSEGVYGDQGSAVNGDHYSPDRRFIVRARIEMPNTSELTLIDARRHRRIAYLPDMNDFVWVPNHPHCLIVAGGGPFGDGFLRMWEDGPRWRNLLRVWRPKREMFVLFGVTRDGQFMIYGHGPSGDLESFDPPHLRQWMRLPQRLRRQPATLMPPAHQRLYWAARYMGGGGAWIDLRAAALAGADLAGADLEGAVLKRANLAGADLSRARMWDANLEKANLHTAHLVDADLRAVSLEGADLTGADLTGAVLEKEGFVPARLHGARYDARTRWPEGFDPAQHGAVLVR